jgi:MFS transporter, NRE family, putaive nickel resistance protein
MSIAIALGNFVHFNLLLLLWLLAGLSQTLAEIPAQILIAEQLPKEEHGKVYGAHFAWSHLWWAIGYPIAGFTGANFQTREFLIGAAISITLFVLINILFYPRKRIGLLKS